VARLTRRWAVIRVTLDPIAGHEQGGHRAALVVSYEPFHSSGMITICPISSRKPKYPNEVVIPRGHAGLEKDSVIIIHQVRSIDVSRVSAWEYVPDEGTQYVTDPSIRRRVRDSLGTHFGLDLPASDDGASEVAES
jgi:mRNA interferase MazF